MLRNILCDCSASQFPGSQPGVRGQEGTIAQIVRSGKNGQKYAQRMAEEEELYASYSDSYINAPFYTNHDMARSAGYYAKDGENRVKLAMALNLLQTGNAFVYYGEELGMRGSGRDENKRAPFPWGIMTRYARVLRTWKALMPLRSAVLPGSGMTRIPSTVISGKPSICGRVIR